MQPWVTGTCVVAWHFRLSLMSISGCRLTLVDLDSPLFRHVLRWRWLIVAVAAVSFIAWELFEHRLTAIVDDRHLAEETLIFGVVGPLLMGLTLSLLERARSERVRTRRWLELEHQLSRELASAGTWEGLVALIARFPRNVLPAIGTSLLVARAEDDRFYTAAEWWASGRPPYPVPAFRNHVCACADSLSPQPSAAPALVQCHHLEGTEAGELVERYCLPLVHAGKMVGLLYHYLTPGLRPTSAEIDCLTALAPAIAVAVDAARPDRALAIEVSATQMERKRIARDLHDTLGPSLGYLHLKLDQLGNHDTLTDIVEIRQELKRMRTVADESYQQVRAVVAGLQTSQIGPTDVRAELQLRADAIGRRAGFKVILRCDGHAIDLSPDVRQQVVHILEEALHNAEKHADAERVTVNLVWRERALTIICTDDGRGFDPALVESDGHFGLKIMRERAREIGGEFTIESRAGGGTQITVSVPLVSAPAAALQVPNEDPTR